MSKIGGVEENEMLTSSYMYKGIILHKVNE